MSMNSPESTNPRWLELRERLNEVDDLRHAGAVLHWDQATYMPSHGATSRGRQLATLSRLAHEKFTDGRLGELLNSWNEADLPPFERAFLRVARRDWERATLVPAAFEAKFSAHTAKCYDQWTRARRENNFELIRPLLEQTLDYSRELAGFFPHEHIADPLIDNSDPGFTTAQIRELFATLRRELVPLVESVTSRLQPSEAITRGDFPENTQARFAREVIGAIGYNWNRGRMDATHHPFMTRLSGDDVRITIRSRIDEATELLFGGLHEAGHGLYEQNTDPIYDGTPLGEGASSGLHESQSRLWENLVGRSRPFWEHFFPRFKETFPIQMANVSVDEWWRAVNRVERGLIRTDADELTYNLHVMIRFDLELEMLEGKLEVRDLPDAWNARYQSDLGVSSTTDSDGCMQDVHWFAGTIGGAFQGYTLGNILSAQFFQSARRELPTLDSQIASGEFAPLRGWLTQHLYRFGRSREPLELVESATGSGLSIAPYLDYLRGKYEGELA